MCWNDHRSTLRPASDKAIEAHSVDISTLVKIQKVKVMTEDGLDTTPLTKIPMHQSMLLLRIQCMVKKMSSNPERTPTLHRLHVKICV